jgi:hypothetical protein
VMERDERDDAEKMSLKRRGQGRRVGGEEL